MYTADHSISRARLRVLKYCNTYTGPIFGSSKKGAKTAERVFLK